MAIPERVEDLAILCGVSLDDWMAWLVSTERSLASAIVPPSSLLDPRNLILDVRRVPIPKIQMADPISYEGNLLVDLLPKLRHSPVLILSTYGGRAASYALFLKTYGIEASAVGGGLMASKEILDLR